MVEIIVVCSLILLKIFQVDPIVGKLEFSTSSWLVDEIFARTHVIYLARCLYVVSCAVFWSKWRNWRLKWELRAALLESFQLINDWKKDMNILFLTWLVNGFLLRFNALYFDECSYGVLVCLMLRLCGKVWKVRMNFETRKCCWKTVK